MKVVALLAVAMLGAAVAKPAVKTDFHPIADAVNAAKAGWTAEVPARFGSLEDVKTVCGTWLKGDPRHIDMRLPSHPFDTNPLKDLPAEFDSRTNWPECKVMTIVRDQSACGSCWAFGSTEAFEDRRCVATKQSIEFSTEDTAGCCSGIFCGFSAGCNGGQPSAALHWMTRTGVVTGGDYFNISEGTSCQPYLLKPCAHHVAPSAKYPACPSGEYSVECKRDCSESKYPKSYKDDKTKGSKAFGLTSVEGMMSSIYSEGPLAVAFSVYSDFPTYKSGVYRHTTGSFLGGHAVEMIGWGTENGTAYWTIRNSWNDQWGDGGYFKILRGSDECGIEDDVTGISF